MKSCHTCGNSYDNCMEVKHNNELYYFDCFECAIHQIAPSCQHCSCKIIGHGIQEDNSYFCCASCARNSSHNKAKNHI